MSSSDSSSRAPGSPPPSPAVLHGKYELGRLLGHGTFGKVYFARDVRTGHNVAMKVVGKDKVLRVGMAEQVKREIAVMKMVTHPNIVELNEVLASKTRIYFAMELVRGGELFAKIAKHGRMKEDAARAYFKQLVSAVDFCHSRGVYHRDLKPENLLLDDAGNLKIADFGLSAFGDHLRQDGLLHTTCGTPAYVAPEVILKKGYDGAKADLWSCGVILYVLLAGFLPFQDDNLMSLYKKIHRGDFKCPPWFSSDARRLVTKLLDPNPATRITVAKLVETPWYKKPVPKSLPQTLRLPEDDDEEVVQLVNSNNNTRDSLGIKTEAATTDGNNNNNNSGPATANTTKPKSFAGGRWGKDKPESLNAFHIISLSEGFDLSPLFQGGRDREDGMRFTTREPASEVISRLEEVAARAGGRFKVRNKSECGVRLEGVERGRKGKLAVAAEMYPVAPSVLVVEVKKDAGDTLEYRSFCSNELRPALKDIMWACPESPPQTTAAA